MQSPLHGRSKDNPNEELYASIHRKMKEMIDHYECPALPEEKRAALDDIMRNLGMRESDIAKV